MNGIQSNLLLLKKSFIYVDSLLVMYSSGTPPHTHYHTHSVCVFVHACMCVNVCVLLCVCVYDEALLLFLQGGELVGREAVLNCTDKIDVQLKGGTAPVRMNIV